MVKAGDLWALDEEKVEREEMLSYTSAKQAGQLLLGFCLSFYFKRRKVGKELWVIGPGH